MQQDISLNDRYDLDRSPVLLNGTQALVRLMLMQAARDRAVGLNTAGLVTGYRGSPLGAVDTTMARARKVLDAADVVFQPGLNEDLAATALWGSQQAELRGEGRFDGVFGLWYGKGPGVDRSGDVMRHANMAGTSRHGGVLMAMGDDHTGESSTTCHQSDWAMVDAYMPVLSPAGVQEILDYGLYGWALSRYAGVWAGLKLMKDTVEVTSVVDGDPHRMSFVTPDLALPEGGLNIRLGDHWIAQEARMIDHKRFAAEAFSRANGMDRRMWGAAGAKIGICAAGKNWLDLVHALSLLGIDEAEALRLGITTYKIGQTFPLDMEGFHDWAEGLELVVVVEEKRKLIEVQVKEALYDDRRGRRVYGWHKGDTWEHGRKVELFPTRMALDPVLIAERLGGIFIEEGRGTDDLRGRMGRLADTRRADNAPELAARTPYFCSGCPHNTSTKVPEGSRAGAGIGCHIMALWMDRDTSGFTHMGAEGANWIGEAPFSKRAHVFQNLGDGTYNHSGILAIRAAIAAGTSITYKILYNDAVAMTGGQMNEGGLSPERIVRELQAMGVQRIAVVYDPKEEPARGSFPGGIEWHERDALAQVQEAMREVAGVSAIVFIQTCAAEKRRRRKKGTFPDPGQRIFINTDVCEGCGDCGVQSNFVTVEGGTLRRDATAEVDVGDLPDPVLPAIDGTHNVVVTGVGGTGVVTIGAVMAMAAHLDGMGAGMMEMAGLAQKGGAVHIHLRLAARPQDISAIRVATGECDVLIGGDLVVSAGGKTLGLCAAGRTGAVVNSHEIVTGDFTRNADFAIPADRLRLALEARMRDGLLLLDSTDLAAAVMGDTIYSNMIVFGAAWQRGLVPLSREAILKAIEMNGASVTQNLRAFEIGRWAAHDPGAAARAATPNVVRLPETTAERIAYRERHLTDYQGTRLARRYRRMLDGIADPAVRDAVARGYHKVLAYKDEYEVARLLTATRAKAAQAFAGDLKLTYHLAPPFLTRPGPDGRPKKRTFGAWIEGAYPALARLRFLRGTPFDPFGRADERRMERALVRRYEADMVEVLPLLTTATREDIVALAELPLRIRGFGPVKAAAVQTAAPRREALLAAIRAGGAGVRHAAE
jgi:indolepyruvate ferredoxin oxidoreductase